MSGAGEFLGRLVGALDAAAIPYMVAGSFASTYHGVPRTTHDIDLVIDPSFRSLRKFLKGLPEDDYYVDATTAEIALKSRGQFNVIDMATGWKVDLIVRKARDFSIGEFSRRNPAEMLGLQVFVATAEDTILSKLEWGRTSGSERQLRDVVGILDVAGEHLDRDYLEGWVEELQLGEVWRRALASAANQS